MSSSTKLKLVKDYCSILLQGAEDAKKDKPVEALRAVKYVEETVFRRLSEVPKDPELKGLLKRCGALISDLEREYDASDEDSDVAEDIVTTVSVSCKRKPQDFRMSFLKGKMQSKLS